MMTTLTHRPTLQRPPSSPSPTLSPSCALNSNAPHFLQRFITVLFPRSGGFSYHRPFRPSKHPLAFTHHSARMI